MQRKVKNILLIDDDAAVNYYHSYIIKNMQLTEKLVVAQSEEAAGKELLALQQSKELSPSLIFLDLSMPKYNGFELIEKYENLFQDLKKKQVTVVMLTTSDNPIDIEKSKTVPIIDEYRQKPMTEEMLIEIMNTYT